MNPSKSEGGGATNKFFADGNMRDSRKESSEDNTKACLGFLVYVSVLCMEESQPHPPSSQPINFFDPTVIYI